MSARGARGNVGVLAVCQGLFTAAIAVDLTLTGLVGDALTTDKSLATLPFALITVAGGVATLFASFLMAHVGRRWAFAAGALAGGCGGAISVGAIVVHSFVWFCVGTALVGVFQAFAQYYRLAAADSAPEGESGKAISAVLTGGMVAALLGPLIAGRSRTLLPGVLFAGSYLVVVALGMLSAALLLVLYREVGPGAAVDVGVELERARPLPAVARQPIFIAATANTVVGNAVMMLIMTAAPLAAVSCGHTIDDGAGIMQWHLVGMFAPAFVSGWLIDRFGVTAVLLAGTALSAACTAIAASASDLAHFYAALLCLGVGWSFMYVGGSVLLVRSATPAERAKAQGLSEFLRYGVTALSSLLAGPLLQSHGWPAVNFVVLPSLAMSLLVTVWWSMTTRPRRSSALLGPER
ncbi:MAG: MFS transporter [Minicystis sp.]